VSDLAGGYQPQLVADFLPVLPLVILHVLTNTGTYDQVKTTLIEKEIFAFSPLLQHVSASGAAGLASAVISTPADVVKTRLMDQSGTAARAYSGIGDALSTIVRTEGVAALWKGFTPILTRKVVWCTVFFVSYERLLELDLPAFL
jgi:solute carrier family 25 uncoupling protein 27